MNLEKAFLEKKHIRNEFDCGIESLNNYIKFQASQDVKRKLSVCYVFVDKNDTVKGYFTLSSSSIPLKKIPKDFSGRLPKSYSNIPVILLGRLAVDNTVSGKGYGEYLLTDALNESYNVSKNKIGAFAVIVDPVDDNITSFYEKYGFIKLPDSGKMFLPMNTIAKLFKAAYNK